VVALGYGFVLATRLSRGFRPTLRGIVPELRILAPSLVGQHGTILGAALPAYILPLVVTARLSPDQTAYFYTTWMLGSIFFIVSPAMAWGLFAEGSHRHDELGRIVRHAAALIGVLLAPLMVAFLVGGKLILSVFGPAYARSGHVLLLALVFSAIPDAITNLFVAVRRVTGRLGQAVALNCSMAATTIALAWVLLPRVGIAGGGWALLGAQTLGALYVCGRLVKDRRLTRRVPILTPSESEAV
jgi:O-antigen/teichoic acid export membrane protein